ncbi:MAG: PAS domain-containing protein [Anaerolineaceae bacterium]|nr:PAS domain-containing protein [Anaerolineaceae bacterium]
MLFGRNLQIRFNTYSLRTQIIASIALLTILSVTVVGLTALWTNYRYLEIAKRQQSLSMVSSFYKAQENQLTDLVGLTSSHLAFEANEELDNPELLQEHLVGIHKGIPKINTILVCDNTGKIISFSGEIIPINNCNLEANPIYTTSIQNGARQVWLLRGRKILDGNTESPTVILGIQLDDQLLMEMCTTCELYHSIIYKEEVIATSFGSLYSEKTNLHALPSRFSDVEFQESYVMGGHVYYVSYFHLNSKGLDVEVALDITSIQQDQRQQELFLTIVILFVVLISVLVGAFLAQLIQRPLSQLVKATNQYEHLDLSEPIKIKTKLHEVVELSQVLENSRKRIESALSSLQKEKQWSDLLLESIVEGIIILDKDGIDYFSPGAERIMNLKEEEALGKSINSILIASDQSNSFLELLPPEGEKLRSKFIINKNEDRILSITHAQLPVNGSGNYQTVLVLRDVNEEEALSHLLGSFLGNITHEFRTPLTALSASIEILMEEIGDLTPSETQELLNSIHLSTLNLENLIDNLLEGSSIETGRFHVNPHPSNLTHVIKTACETMDPLLKKYGQRLIINIPPDLPLVIIDGRRINQVLLNMISNASKYGPSDDEIELKAVMKNGFIEISVGDRGKGVPEPYRNKIFSGFVLNKDDYGRMQKGSGLGLSVSQTIIRAHGGQVGVRDRKGGGSEFWFSIPITGET